MEMVGVKAEEARDRPNKEDLHVGPDVFTSSHSLNL